MHEVARCTALLEAIDRELDERGLVDKHGKPRYLLPHRARISRQLEQWLSKIALAIEPPASEQELSTAGRAEYVRELQRIAFGHDPNASTRDRLSALKELLKFEPAASKQAVGAVFHVYRDGSVVDDEGKVVSPGDGGEDVSAPD